MAEEVLSQLQAVLDALQLVTHQALPVEVSFYQRLVADLCQKSTPWLLTNKLNTTQKQAIAKKTLEILSVAYQKIPTNIRNSQNIFNNTLGKVKPLTNTIEKNSLLSIVTHPNVLFVL